MKTPLILAFCLVIALVSGRDGLFTRHNLLPRQKATLCPGHPLPSASPSDVLSKLQPILAEAAKNISAALEADKSPGGVAINVVYNDTVLWNKGFGVINESDPSRRPPDGNTGFRIGSITKVFTSLMTLMLRDSGALQSIDQNITRYLPAFSIKNPFETNRGITFRQLASHMSGLPRNPPCPGLFVTGCSLSYDKIYQNLAGMELMYPPGERPAYSNLGFGLLGRALEQIRGPTWEQGVREMVFGPLGMNNSGNSFTNETIKHIALGYYPSGAVADFINIGWDAPAGQMYASANDLSKLMSLIFRPLATFDPEKGQILDGESIREWLQPAYVYADGTGFSFPWELIPLRNYTMRTKDGAINGYNAEFQMLTEIKTGFVFLHSCDGCGSHGPITGIAQGILLAVSDILQSMQPGPRVPPDPSEYVGNYVATVGFTDSVNITLLEYSGHKFLAATERGLVLILDWTVGDNFQLSVSDIAVPCYILGSGTVGERVYFQRAGSTVVSLTVPGLEYGRVYKKQT